MNKKPVCECGGEMELVETKVEEDITKEYETMKRELAEAREHIKNLEKTANTAIASYQNKTTECKELRDKLGAIRRDLEKQADTCLDNSAVLFSEELLNKHFAKSAEELCKSIKEAMSDV